MSDLEKFTEQPRRICKANTVNELPSLIERGGVRNAYIELPPHKYAKEFETLGVNELKGFDHISTYTTEYEKESFETLLGKLLQNKKVNRELREAILAQYRELQEIFHDYEICGVSISGVTQSYVDDDEWHADEEPGIEYALSRRRVIVNLGGKPTEHADNIEGVNAVSPKGRVISVHRISEGEKSVEKVSLGGYHRRPTPEQPRLILILDIIKKARSPQAREFRT